MDIGRLVIAVALRVGALVASWWVCTRAWPEDDVMGPGFLMLLPFVGVAMLWGAVDGLWLDLAGVAARWFGAGALLGVLIFLQLAITSADTDPLGVVFDLFTGVTLVSLPAVGAGAITFHLRPRDLVSS